MQKKTIIHLLGIYLLLMIIIPKSFTNLAGIIPIRLLLSFIYVFTYIVYKIINKEKLCFEKKHIILGLLFLISFIPSLFTTTNLIVSIYSIIKFGLALLVFISVYSLKLNKNDISIIIKYLLSALIIVLIYGLIQYIFKVNLFTIGSYNYPGSRGRISATFFNTIYFSIFLNFMICIFTYLAAKSSNNKQRVINILFLVLSFLCMLLTFTRSAILVFTGSLLITIIFNNKIIFNKVVLLTYIAMISCSFLIPGVPALYSRTFGDVNTLAKTSETEDPSLEHRIQFSEIGVVLGKDYFPNGIGVGSFEDYVNSNEYTLNYPEYAEYKTHPHSALILLFAEASIWPIIVIIIILLFLAIDLIKIWYKNKNIDIKQLAVLTATILGGFTIVNVIAENAIYDSQIFPIFLIIIGGLLSYINEVKVCQK